MDDATVKRLSVNRKDMEVPTIRLQNGCIRRWIAVKAHVGETSLNSAVEERRCKRTHNLCPCPTPCVDQLRAKA